MLLVGLTAAGCSYGMPRLVPAAQPAAAQPAQGEETPTAIAKLEFVLATPTPILRLKGQDEAVAEAKGTPDETRAFENGQSLAARVNGAPIFLVTFEQQIGQIEQLLRRQGVDLGSEASQQRLKRLQQQALEGLVEQQLIRQETQRLGITVPPEDVEADAQAVIDQLGSAEQFETWLADNGLTYPQFIENLRFQMVANRLFETATQNAPRSGEQIRLRIIQVRDEAAAQTIIDRLNSGESFDLMAEQQSLHEGSLFGDGDLGWLPRNAGLIPADVEAVAFGLQPGEVSKPIPTTEGFYIVKIEEKETDRIITDAMRQHLKKQIFNEWLLNQRASAVIERFVTW